MPFKPSSILRANDAPNWITTIKKNSKYFLGGMAASVPNVRAPGGLRLPPGPASCKMTVKEPDGRPQPARSHDSTEELGQRGQERPRPVNPPGIRRASKSRRAAVSPRASGPHPPEHGAGSRGVPETDRSRPGSVAGPRSFLRGSIPNHPADPG